jgi:hypothetical protein
LKHLFLDDFHIQRIDNLARKMHQPERFAGSALIRPEYRWENLTCQIRNTPVWDPEAGLYKMIYAGKAEVLEQELEVDQTGNAPKTIAVCYATSEDGVNWEKPFLGIYDYRGLNWNGTRIGTENNIIHVGDSLFTVYDPNDDDQSRRFKGVIYRDGALHPTASPDHVHWQELGYPPCPTADQSHFTYDAEIGVFIATVKHRGPYGRSWYVTTSDDFKNWSEQLLVFHADQVDQENGFERLQRFFDDPAYLTPVYNRPEEWRTDVYNYPVFPYEGLYIGMPVMHHWSGKHPPLYENVDSRKSVELTCSRDLINWERVANRAPFQELAPVEDGSNYDTGQIQNSNGPIVRGDKLYFYYSGLRARSSTVAESMNRGGLDAGAICMARLRIDGFVSLKGGIEPGSLVTEPMQIDARQLHVNIDAWRGQVRAEILESSEDRALAGFSLNDCIPASVDHVDVVLRWQGHEDLSSLQGRTVRIRFSLLRGEIYAFWFD